MTVNLFDPIFTDADKAREHLEGLLWPHGPVCPRCGSLDNLHKLGGKPNRDGLHQCNACHRSFTVTVGTIFESSHVPLNKWLLASHLLCASKKGMSAHQLHRTISVTYKTAWFMAHRIRAAMAPGANRPPMGGKGKVVEVDETYHGKVAEPRAETTSGRPYTKGGKTGVSNKRAIVSLVERGGACATLLVTSEWLWNARLPHGLKHPNCHLAAPPTAVIKLVELAPKDLSASFDHHWCDLDIDLRLVVRTPACLVDHRSKSLAL